MSELDTKESDSEPSDLEDQASDEAEGIVAAQSGRSPMVVALMVATVVLALDQVTKGWAVSRLAEGSCTPETCVDVIGSLRFRLHYNTGASFSTGEGFGPVIGVIALCMSVYLIWLARTADQRLQVILLGTIAGGAVGNLADRVFRATDGILSGGVVDFIDFQWWPIFNIADMAIIGGVIVLLLTQFVQSRGR